MTTTINPIPDGFHTLTPYLVVQGAADALEFYKKAFDAAELFRLDAPGGKIAHAEFKMGDSIFMLADENPQCAEISPKTLGGTPVKLHLYVTDTDAVFAAAIKAGATETMPPTDQFWGDRMGAVSDPFGHHWLIATHIEDIDPNELQGRMEAFFAAQASCAE
ncbi:MAG: VOC family protein [Methylovulum sp.]|uniref:VOC family protein n=1 Tax=Methylovulum sp. TaxID=1916980 RepID=UPI00260BFEB6|nr:VOC family protein [Methylovulum sp.]MDD2723142.1 VOC family protein [Methylovulum sp.]MDD5125508.1 VOC family protein [Methylovulum sp.]